MSAKTVIIGGSFNPVHIGHLYIAGEVSMQLGYEEVLFVPAHIAAHKTADTDNSADRLSMLSGALKGTGFSFDDCELKRGGVSYSITTVEDIYRRRRVDGKLGFVIGDDLLSGFHLWKEALALSEMVDLIVVHRLSEERVPFSFPHRYIDNLMLPVSSREIRRRVHEGLSFRFLVPEAVFSYINEHNLYRCG
jgi:nicotinate-nucleotide adenylyltransferase